MKAQDDYYLAFQVRILFGCYFLFTFGFGVNALIQHKTYIGIVLLFISLLVILLLSIVERKRYINLFVKVSVAILSAFFVIVWTLHGGHENTGYLWSLTIFIVLIQLLGTFAGSALSVLLLSSILLISELSLIAYPISNRFYFIAISVILVTAIHNRILDDHRLKLKNSLHQKHINSITNPLTGVFNRRYIDNEIFGHSRQVNDGQLAVLIIDVDDFKRINDQFGHVEGDRALKQVASLTLKNTRAEDFTARWGGDEFMLVMKNVSSNHLTDVAERLVEQAKDVKFADGTHLTLSIGGASSSESIDELFKQADDELLKVKRTGKNNYSIV